MKIVVKLSVVFVFFISQVTFAQSPWTREKGKAYLQLGFSGLFYNQAQIDGNTVNLGYDVSDITLQVYSEYGISNKLEIQAILPYKTVGRTIAGSQNQNFSGIGNVSLGLKYKVIDKNWKLSTGVLFTARTSTYDPVTDLSTGFDAATALPYFTLGTSSGKWYYYGNIGYGYMTNDFSDFFRFNAEVGYTIIPKGHIILALDTRNIVSNEEAFVTGKNQWESYLDRQTYNAVGLKFNYEFTKDKFGVNLSAFGAFGNNNAPLAPSLNLGVYAKL